MSDVETPLLVDTSINVPGTSSYSKAMLPFRFVATLISWIMLYPLTLIIAMLRAIYLRCCKGRPSQILKTGTYGAAHVKDMHYGGMQTYHDPLDEARFRKALVSLCKEDGIEEDEIDLKFFDEKPNDWPETGSFQVDYFIESLKKKAKESGYLPGEYNYLLYDMDKKDWGGVPVKVRLHVWNNDPGKPTIVYYYGSGFAWDGSSQFNFTKELMNRYMGNAPNNVFQKPELKQESADKFDQGWFLCFLLKMPFHLARTWWMLLWNVVRSCKWAGGNGFGFRFVAMNFTEAESNMLYAGAKSQGMSPFAAFTYAAVKACEEVLGQKPVGITQQASMQTRHYPLPGQADDMRDLVGDWLLGVLQAVPEKYGKEEAMAGYKELVRELDEVGPATTDAIMCKAYGLVNSGAATFQGPPTYNTWNHPWDRNLFMNNYGVRTMPEGSPFHSWNWNAPIWVGVNTINVDGRTTTLVGSALWGVKVVEKLRDNIEGTLRKEFMDKAGESEAIVPKYSKARSGIF